MVVCNSKKKVMAYDNSFHFKIVFIFLTVKEGTINTLVGNHSKMLYVYQDITLKWATQLPHVPVSVKVANLQ